MVGNLRRLAVHMASFTVLARRSHHPIASSGREGATLGDAVEARRSIRWLAQRLSVTAEYGFFFTGRALAVDGPEQAVFAAVPQYCGWRVSGHGAGQLTAPGGLTGPVTCRRSGYVSRPPAALQN